MTPLIELQIGAWKIRGKYIISNPTFWSKIWIEMQ